MTSIPTLLSEEEWDIGKAEHKAICFLLWCITQHAPPEEDDGPEVKIFQHSRKKSNSGAFLGYNCDWVSRDKMFSLILDEV